MKAMTITTTDRTRPVMNIKANLLPLLIAAFATVSAAPPASSKQSDTHAHSPEAHMHAPIVDVDEDAGPAVDIVERFGKALAAGDLKTVGDLLDPAVLILESGGAERSRDEYLGHHAVSDAAFLRGADSQITRRRARISGDMAWVGTESELHATRDGKQTTLLSTETMVLRRTPEGWRIAHIHWSSRPKR